MAKIAFPAALRGRLGVIAMALGLTASLLPLLTTRVLPFHDLSGLTGLSGALVLRDDPAAAIARFYDLDIRAYPSALYFGWALLMGALGVPIEVGFSLFVALFCLLGLPLAMVVLLRAFGRPPALALLVLPVSYHHQLWYGFVGSAAALTGMILALAFARRILAQAPRLDRSSLANHLGLAASLLFVAAAHPFPLALTLAVLAPALLWPPPGAPSGRQVAVSIAARLATTVPMAVFLINWAGGFFNRPDTGRSLVTTVRTSFAFEAPGLGDGGQYLAWLGNGYLGAADEIVPAVALATLAVLLIRGICPREEVAVSDAAAGRRDWILLGTAAALLVAGYLFLPMKLVWPEHWWGVRVRCVVPSFLLLLTLVRPRRQGLRPWVLAPAVLVALGFFVFVALDFGGHFRSRVLHGFDDAIAAIPPGQSVLGFTVRPDPHYTEAHPYLVQHYVARKGGRAVPHLRGHRGSYWITMKPPPESPDWGDPLRFDWGKHGDWDYFLIERPLVDAGFAHPMRSAPPGAVRQVFAQGQFEVWQRVR